MSKVDDYFFKLILKISKKPEDFKNYLIGEGFRVYNSLVKSDLYNLRQCFIAQDRLNKFDRFMIDSDKMQIVTEDFIEKISSLSKSPGIIGLFEKKHISDDLNYSNELISETFILWNITDPGNMGTIIRTAVALNRKSIVLIDGCCHFSKKVIQSSAGTIGHIKIIKTTWENFLQIRNINIPIYALDTDGENINKIQRHEMNICYIVIGNEASGIPNEIIEQVDRIISIPMSKNCESLNAAIAASIAGYKSWNI